MELEGIEISISDQSLLANGLSYLARSRGVCKNIRRCWRAMGAQYWQPGVAVDFVIVATDINGITLVRFAVTSPGYLAPFRCRPEELVWWKVAGKDFVG